MAKTSKTVSSLRLVVVGQGETRGRRPHLLRLRESLIRDLREVADGQMYLLVEVALRRLIDDLKMRDPGIEVIQSVELESGPEDEYLLEQWQTRVSAHPGRSAAQMRKYQGMPEAPATPKKAVSKKTTKKD